LLLPNLLFLDLQVFTSSSDSSHELSDEASLLCSESSMELHLSDFFLHDLTLRFGELLQLLDFLLQEDLLEFLEHSSSSEHLADSESQLSFSD
jgi:hypothetical protein